MQRVTAPHLIGCSLVASALSSQYCPDRAGFSRFSGRGPYWFKSQFRSAHLCPNRPLFVDAHAACLHLTHQAFITNCSLRALAGHAPMRVHKRGSLRTSSGCDALANWVFSPSLAIECFQFFSLVNGVNPQERDLRSCSAALEIFLSCLDNGQRNVVQY